MAFFVASVPCMGGTLEWNNASGGNMGASSNWSGGAYSQNQDLVFSEAGVNGNFDVLLRGNSTPTTRSPNSILVSQTGQVTILPGGNNSNILNVGAGGIDVHVSGRLIVQANLTLGSNQTWFARDPNPNAPAAGDRILVEQGATWGTTLNLGVNDLTIRGGGRTTLQAPIVGSGSLNKMGGGILTLGGNNTFSGGINVSDGDLRITNDTNLGTGTVVIDGATFHIIGPTTIDNSIEFFNTGNVPNFLNTGTNAVTLSGAISGSGVWEKRGTGRLTLSGVNTQSGGVSIAEGTIQATTTSIGGPITISSGAFLDFDQDSDGVFNAPISGSGALVKNGSGSVTLNSPHHFTYTGTTTINEGNLTVWPENFVSNAVIANNASLTFSFSSLDLTYPGSISGAGSLIKTANGTLRLTGNNTHSGGTFIQGGTIQATTETISGAVTISSDASLVLEQDTSGVYNSPISGSGTLVKRGTSRIVLNTPNTFSVSQIEIENGVIAAIAGSVTGNVNVGTSGTLELSATTQNPNQVFTGTISGTGIVRKSGSDTVTLNGSNSYTGGTNVEAGTLVGSASSIQGPTNILAGAQLVFNQQQDGVYLSSISGSGSVTKTGPGILTLNAPNSHTGLTTNQQGILIGLSSSFPGNVHNNGTLIFRQGTNGTYAGVISGTGTFEKQGVGIVTLTGANTFTGKTNVNGFGALVVNGSLAGSVDVLTGSVRGSGSVGGDVLVLAGGTLGGTLTVGGTVTNQGRVAPGDSPGIIMINGDYIQETTAALEIEVQGLTPGSEHDQLQVTGTATLGGRLEVPILNSFVPMAGHAPIQFLTAGTRVGEFNAIIARNLPANLTLEVNYQADGATIEFVPIKANIVFDETTDATADWFDDIDTWEDPSAPGTPVIPREVHDISLQNLVPGSQQVNVQTANAFVAKLTVGGGTNILRVNIGNGNSSDDMGNFSSTLGVNVNSNGIIALNQDTLATSDVMIDGGVLEGSGLIDLDDNNSTVPGSLTLENGIVSPGLGGIGSITVDGDYHQMSGGDLVIELAGRTAADGYDTLEVSGSVALTGDLVVSAIQESGGLRGNNIFEPNIGDTFEIITSDKGVTGTFSSASLPSLPPNWRWDIIYATTSVSLTVLSTSDFNGDGQVNGADFSLWAANFGITQSGTSANGDVDGDGDVDGSDFLAWQATFSLGSGNLSADASVPEPTSLCLAACLLFGVWLKRSVFFGTAR